LKNIRQIKNAGTGVLKSEVEVEKESDTLSYANIFY
jgi:hypothetical protein